MSLLLCCVRSAHKVSKLPVFSLELTLLTFINSFHIIDIFQEYEEPVYSYSTYPGRR